MLKEKIRDETKKAIKEGNELTVSTLRMLSASIVSREKEKRYKISKQKPDLNEEGLIKESQLTDEEILDVISSEIKKRKDSVAAYRQGKREELAQKEEKEIVILQKYLPEQLSEKELRKIIEETINNFYAKEIHPVKSADEVGGVPPKAEQFNRVKDMGKIMSELMPKVKGKADGSMVSKLVKESLDAK